MSRQSRYAYLIRMGFLPSEAKQLSHTSKIGLQAPYMARFIRSRNALNLNRKKLGWTDFEYREIIRRQYADRGAFRQDILGRIRADVWQMLRWYEERTPQQANEYESPWKKKLSKKSGQRRTMKVLTRKQLMQSWIAQLQVNIANPNTSPERRAKFQQQVNNLQKQLDQLA